MLENWGWEPKVLKKISSHYGTQEPLPDDLTQRGSSAFDKPVKTWGHSSWLSGGLRIEFVFTQMPVRQCRAVLPSTAFLRNV